MSIGRILKNCLNEFVERNDFQDLSESEKFENFVNFLTLRNRTPDEIDLSNITTGADDDGIDGIAILINEKLSHDGESAKFNMTRTENKIEIIFTQSKTSSTLENASFDRFLSSIRRFLVIEKEESCDYKDEVLKSARESYDFIVDNFSKIQEGQISLVVRYVTTGEYDKPYPSSFEISKNQFVSDMMKVEGGGYFSVDIQCIGSTDLSKQWRKYNAPANAKLPVQAIAQLPVENHQFGIGCAYLVVAKAKDFVNNMLVNENGKIKHQVFEENVRSFLGEDKNPVNKSIGDTLRSDQRIKFSVLNNGITIVGSKISNSFNKYIGVENYQIVNGCQTSNILFENQEFLGDEVMVTIKIIQVSHGDGELFRDIVKSTNNQTKIENNQMYSLTDFAKKVEGHFETEKRHGIVFERREQQHKDSGIGPSKIFSLHTAARATAACFLNKPEMAFKYQRKMYDDIGGELFDVNNKPSSFYTACLVYNKLSTYLSKHTEYKKEKWLIICLFRMLSMSEGDFYPGSVPINSRQMDAICENLTKILDDQDRCFKKFDEAVELIKKYGQPVTTGRLRGKDMLQEIISSVKQERGEIPPKRTSDAKHRKNRRR